jgi:DEAD/DEAH box helicase domain-containing protein
VDVSDYVVLEERESIYGFRVVYAKILLEVSVEGYILKNLYSGEVLHTESLDPPITYKYVTRAVLFRLPRPETYSELDSAEAFHAIEHAVIEASRVTCGAGLTDLGGISYPSGDIVVYDSEIGGTGLSKLLYKNLEKTIDTAYEIMSKCTCDDGCPRCIYTPYCGNNNRVLSKKKAIYTLNYIYSKKPLLRIPPIEERYGAPLV